MLEELYYGRFALWEQVRTTTEAYHQALRTVIPSWSSCPEYELVLKLQEQASIAKNEEVFSNFQCGFLAGMLLMGEVHTLADSGGMRA